MLVVEDNLHMRWLVRDMLRAFGIDRVYEAGDGSAALQVMAEKNGKLDIVITDWAMTPMDGYQLTKEIRHYALYQQIPIIMMTPYTERRRVRAARDAGVSELLAKPFSANTMLGRLISVIEEPRPFIKSANYIGPCRRRRTEPHFGPERRKNNQDIEK